MIAMQALIHDGIRTSAALRSIEGIMIAGSGVTNEAMSEFKASLTPEAALRINYGCTEAGPVSGENWGTQNTVDIKGYVGHLYHNMGLRLVDPDTGIDCEAGISGEVCLSSPHIFSRYCGNAEMTKAAFLVDEEGRHWFRTGDMGRSIGERGLAITGRYKEIFKVDHEEVAPVEVEQVLLKHEGVEDVAVTSTEARDNPLYFEVKAYVVPSKVKKVVAQELVDFVAARLSPHKAPTGGVVMVDAIPRNPMKKVVARKLILQTPLPGSEGYLMKAMKA